MIIYNIARQCIDCSVGLAAHGTDDHASVYTSSGIAEWFYIPVLNVILQLTILINFIAIDKFPILHNMPTTTG